MRETEADPSGKATYVRNTQFYQSLSTDPISSHSYCNVVTRHRRESSFPPSILFSRSRYRDDEDELRPRKHPDRSRDRYYDRDRDRGVVERGRDRSLLDRGKDRGRGQEGEKQERVGHRPPIDKEDRSRSKESRSKDTQEGIGESSPSRVRDRNYDRTTASSTAPSTTSTTTTTTSSTTTTTTS